MTSEDLLCPECLGGEFEQTCVGHIGAWHPERDPNTYTCTNCGWKGKAAECMGKVSVVLYKPASEVHEIDMKRKA